MVTLCHDNLDKLKPIAPTMTMVRQTWRMYKQRTIRERISENMVATDQRSEDNKDTALWDCRKKQRAKLQLIKLEKSEREGVRSQPPASRTTLSLKDINALRIILLPTSRTTPADTNLEDRNTGARSIKKYLYYIM